MSFSYVHEVVIPNHGPASPETRSPILSPSACHCFSFQIILLTDSKAINISIVKTITIVILYSLRLVSMQFTLEFLRASELAIFIYAIYSPTKVTLISPIRSIDSGGDVTAIVIAGTPPSTLL